MTQKTQKGLRNGSCQNLVKYTCTLIFWCFFWICQYFPDFFSICSSQEIQRALPKLMKNYQKNVTKKLLKGSKSILEKNRWRQLIGLKDVLYTTSIFNLLRITSERNHQDVVVRWCGDAVVLHLHQFTEGFFLSQFKFEHDNSFKSWKPNFDIK